MNHRSPRVRATRAHAALVGTLAVALAAGCGDPQTEPIDWAPAGEASECNLDAQLQARSYGTKVKTLLTGLALTDDELVQLESDPSALAGLIDTWLASPESDVMLMSFFATAFQQTELDQESFAHLIGRAAFGLGRFENPNSAQTWELMNNNFKESFARTVLALVREGRPFHEVLTTNTWMLTTAQMAFLAYTDDEAIDDEGNRLSRTSGGQFDTVTLVTNQADAPPFDQALDPNSPSFGTFWHANLADAPAACNVAPSQAVNTTGTYADGEWRTGNNFAGSHFVFLQLMGRHEAIRRHRENCFIGASNVEPILRREDFTDWRPVTIRPPSGPEQATLFYDLDELRAGSELILHRPHVGFFSTPAFFSTWPNNEDNSSRVTINQILIVALGASFDGEAVSDFSPTQLDTVHAEPGTPCYGCHQTLDPMRDYVRASFTNFYGQQLDSERQSLSADFVFKGVQASGGGVEDLSQVLRDHDLFPRAWAQKLCYLANAAACPEGPEFDRVVDEFVAANYDFRALVRELFASPLITGAECADGTGSGTQALIARRSQFCAQLSHRLGLPDICRLSAPQQDGNNLQNNVHNATGSIPDDSFSRAVVEPVVIADTSMFTRANRDAACTLAAQIGYVDAFGDASTEDALLRMVESVMGLPVSDPRHAPALAILQEHYDEARAAGEFHRRALMSALVLACMSPGSAGVGF